MTGTVEVNEVPSSICWVIWKAKQQTAGELRISLRTSWLADGFVFISLIYLDCFPTCLPRFFDKV